MIAHIFSVQYSLYAYKYKDMYLLNYLFKTTCSILFLDTEDFSDDVILRIVNKSRLAIQVCRNTMNTNCRFDNYAVSCVNPMPYPAIIVPWLLILLIIMKSV